MGHGAPSRLPSVHDSFRRETDVRLATVLTKAKITG
jgi:hypothetical protein